MNEPQKYFAFISYKREDEEWAVWFQHELEYYHLPASLNGREDLPKEFRPVFRDVDELKAGNLPEQIHEALASSANLIVICSPRSADSIWVNKEIESFVEIGNEKGINNLDRVFPFIVEGTPHAKDKTEECFPKILRDLPDDKERIGGNVNESGRDKAFIKVMAGMLPNISMDTLWNRYERDKAEEERKKREERDKLLVMQSRFLSEKINHITKQDSYLARLLALEILPKDLSNPDRPYTPEAEKALRSALDYNSAVLRGHTSFVSSVSYSRNGKLIVSSSYDHTARVWDVKTGRQLIILNGHHWTVNSAYFSPDGKTIVTASDDQTIGIWDSKTGQLIRFLEGHTMDVKCAVFCPDGKRIFSASGDKTIRIWDVQTGELLQIWTGHDKRVNSISFSPDGETLVSASDDQTMCLWDNKTGQKLTSFKGHTGEVCYASFSPDGRRIVSASHDKTIRVWDVKTGQCIQILEGHTSQVHFVTFSPNGKHIVSASLDRTVLIWDTTNSSIIQTLEGHVDEVHSVAFSPDGHSIVTGGDNTVRIWDFEKDNVCSFCENGIESFFSPTISPDGKLRISTSKNDGIIHIYDTETGLKVRKLVGHFYGCISAVFSPDGKHIASTSLDFTIRIWSIETGHLQFKKDYSNSLIVPQSVAYSPDGKYIVLAMDDGTIRVLTAETAEELRTIVGHTACVNSAAFSPDGKRIVSASKDNTIRVWDTETGKELKTFYYGTSEISSVAFHPDGNKIIAQMHDGTTTIWPFPPLQQLIDQTRERFIDRPLTDEERKMYYLE
jgi:WD40 repeat protein